MSKRFSKSFKTFSDWKAQSKDTPYRRRIERLHVLHPKSSLSQLRSHPKGREKPLSKMKPKPLSKLNWDFLFPKQKRIRVKSSKVLRLMRREGYSLTKASREVGISPNTVKRHTGALKRDAHRWRAKKYDSLTRVMNINENGRSHWVEIKDSRHASLIGRYQNAVKKFLESDDESILKPFRDRKVKDINGNWHTLETDPDNLYDIHERRADEEFYTIYKQ